jgi:hypothetical protein
MAHQGQYPVILITFKFTDSLIWETCFEKLKQIISKEYMRHHYLLDSVFLYDVEKNDFIKIVRREADRASYETSLSNLTAYLANHWQQAPIVLIDEYDVPIHAGYRHGYFMEVTSFIKSFLGDGLKGNKNLKFSVVTGALRVAKESIFTGLNNLEVCTF